jgi:hypothetical protein
VRFLAGAGDCAILVDTSNTGITLFLSAIILSHAYFIERMFYNTALRTRQEKIMLVFASS